MRSQPLNLALYQKIQKRVADTNCAKLLRILSCNITRCVSQNKVHNAFLILATHAQEKSNTKSMQSKLPLPINNTILEAIAFNNTIDAAAFAKKSPGFRVIHHQLKKLGYAATFARQVTKQVASDRFLQLRAKGLDKFTAESFVYHYAEHLVTPEVYANVKALFQPKPQILFPSNAALAA